MSSAPEYRTTASAAKIPKCPHRRPSCQHPARIPRPPCPMRLQTRSSSVLTSKQCLNLPCSASCVVRWRGCCLDREDAVVGNPPKAWYKEPKQRNKLDELGEVEWLEPIVQGQVRRRAALGDPSTEVQGWGPSFVAQPSRPRVGRTSDSKEYDDGETNVICWSVIWGSDGSIA